jgi:uncharacterized protein YhfF
MKLLRTVFTIAAFAVLFGAAGCDMEYVNGTIADVYPAGSPLSPGAITAAEHNYLTIANLPPNISEFNISNVYIWNQAGKVAECEDYTQLVVQTNGTTATLGIPLWYTAADQKFAETGSYFVSFDLNVDALTRIKITEKEKVIAVFLSGNGVLDAHNLPQSAATRYLTIANLPYNTANNCFSNIAVYNSNGKVARCTNYEQIVITGTGGAATASIPLVYVDDATEPFRNTGSFIVEFTCYIDVYSQIIFTPEMALVADFVDGAGSVDLSTFYGYFSGTLINADNTLAPLVQAGTEFEMNGSFYQIENTTAVKTTALTQTGLVYLYAVPKPGGVEFECLAAPPVFNAFKNGYYSGTKRALYKLAFIRDAGSNLYAAKTPVGDPFTQFAYTAVNSYALSFISGQEIYALSGSTNPDPQTRTLSPGGYIFVLKGSGGGGGGGIDGDGGDDRYGGTGGQGGFLIELVTLSDDADFTLYTGTGGGGAGYISYGLWQGAGAGGGGSGSFIYAGDGYFAVAGGGGGGGGGSGSDGGGGGGGAGGSIGNGGVGGKGGDDQEYSSYYDTWILYPGSSGGTGGGKTYTLGAATTWGYAGSGGYGDDQGQNGGGGGSAGYTVYDFPDQWKNTNGANGQGGNGPHNANGGGGGAGGTNRNAVRGGGASGGAAGSPSDGPGSAGSAGSAGSITVYQIF